MQPSIVRLGHPILRFPAEPVDVERLNAGECDDLIVVMRETLQNLKARSLAAPQLGSELQILVFPGDLLGGPSDGLEPQIVVNPMLEPEHGDPVYDWEGCLSVPDLKGLVPRYPAVRLRGLDESGELIDLVAKDRSARILQHAYDHLGGLVFLDRMGDLRSLAFAEEWREFLQYPGARSSEDETTH